MKDKEMLSENYLKWKKGDAYFNEKNLNEIISENVDFKEGRQWKNITPATQHIPRPVINFVEMIVDNKRSNILGTPCKLNFIADGDEESTEMFTRFAKYQMADMQQDYYDDLAINDGLVKGTYCFYYYWDEKAVGKKGIYKGALRCELIDARNIRFSNPKEVDVQKMKWVIIRSREDVETVKGMCTINANKELIVADELENSSDNDIDQEDNNLVTIYTRFFRKDGEVYYIKSTRNVDITKPIAMNPNLIVKELKEKSELEKEEDKNEDKENIKVDPAKSSNMDNTLENAEEEEYKDTQYMFSLYPIEIGSLKPRDHCIYGLSEVESLIPNQKALNFQLSMVLLNSQELGWGKWIVKQGSLKGQVINNKPGQVLVDYSPNGVSGITKVQGQQISGDSINLITSMIDLCRTVTNSTEIITGDIASKDLSGTAIAQLQAQAQKPIDGMQKRFWRSKERIGKILELYYKLYYEEEPFSYDLDEAERERREEEIQRKVTSDGYNGETPKVPTTQLVMFNGNEFIEKSFNIVVEAGQGTQYSEIMAMQTLNTLFLNGTINNMSSEQLEQYITLYPDSAMPFKNDLKRIIKKQQAGELQQCKDKLMQAVQYIQQLMEQINLLQGQQKYSKEFIDNLTNEYTNKINMQNDEIKKMASFMQSQKIGTNKEL